MGKDLRRLARKLKAKELEIKIQKDIEKIENQANSKEDFFDKIKPLIQKIFKLDFGVAVIKEKDDYALKSLTSRVNFDSDLFIRMAQDLVETKLPLVINTTWKHKKL